jgi:predicted peroxiredoxin
MPMKMLFVGTHGSESPTHALLPFLSAQGAIDEGHEVELLLMGDAVVLMHEAVAKNTTGVGWPSVGEVLGKLIEHKVPVYV